MSCVQAELAASTLAARRPLAVQTAPFTGDCLCPSFRRCACSRFGPRNRSRDRISLSNLILRIRMQNKRCNGVSRPEPVPAGGNPNQFVRNSLTVYARVQYNAAVDSRCMSANPETGFMLCYVFGHDADAQGACGLACTAHENIPMSRKKLSPSCGSDGRWPWLGGCFVTTPSWLCFDDGCRGAVAPPYVTRNVPAAC